MLIDKPPKSWNSRFAGRIASFDLNITVTFLGTVKFAFVNFVVKIHIIFLHVFSKILIISIALLNQMFLYFLLLHAKSHRVLDRIIRIPKFSIKNILILIPYPTHLLTISIIKPVISIIKILNLFILIITPQK